MPADPPAHRRFPVGRRLRLTPEERRALLDALFFEGPELVPHLYRLATLLALSAIIATLGLMSDSAAVVIGAMLIAPLMTPTMALAASLVMGWPRRQLNAALLLAGASAGAVGIAWALSALLPSPEGVVLLSAELRARTEPRVIDLLIALAAGAAGAYVAVRAKAAAALPGAAIAVALLPPLATAGILLELGEHHLAGQAFLLFATNLAAIVLAAALVLLLTGFVPNLLAVRGRERRIIAGLAIAVLAGGAVAYPLYLHSSVALTRARTVETVSEEVQEWLGERDLQVERLELTDDEETVALTVDLTGDAAPPPVTLLADRVVQLIERPAEVVVRWTERRTERAETNPRDQDG